MKKALLSLAIVGSMFGGFTSAQAAVGPVACAYPVARASVTTSVPYGGSAAYNDLYTVKVINTGPACASPTVVITPRVGRGFTAIVSANGGWACAPLSSGDPGSTVCTNSTLAASSISTIRVQYDGLTPASGTATAELSFP